MDFAQQVAHTRRVLFDSIDVPLSVRQSEAYRLRFQQAVYNPLEEEKVSPTDSVHRKTSFTDSVRSYSVKTEASSSLQRRLIKT